MTLTERLDHCLRNERHWTHKETEYWLNQYKQLAMDAIAMFSKAGSTKSKAKSKAARENGKLGGRPRKNA